MDVKDLIKELKNHEIVAYVNGVKLNVETVKINEDTDEIEMTLEGA